MVFLLSSAAVDLLNLNKLNLPNLNINHNNIKLLKPMLVKLMPRHLLTALKPTITISMHANGILKTSRPVNAWLPITKKNTF